MVTAADFNALLEQEGLPPAYHFDGAVLEAQQTIAGSVGALEAFAFGLKALFLPAEAGRGRDDFHTLVTTQPEAFALTAEATPEQIRQVIVAALRQDPQLGFYLLPESSEPVQAAEVTLFPPEEGESVRDFWIWFVRCPGFFPGPAWLLVNRQDAGKAYHYGYL